MARRLVPADTASRTLVASGIGVLIVGLVVGLAVPAASVPGRGPGSASDTTGQVDPEAAGSGADLSAFERQLADRLANRARSGAANLSSGDYQQVRERLNGTQYESLLSEYESVATERGGREQVVAYRRMLVAQRAFVAVLDRYDTVHGRYRSAQYGPSVAHIRPSTEQFTGANQFGPDSRSVVALAHRLERIEYRVERLGQTLLDRYRRLERVSNRSFADSRASVRNQTTTVRTRQAAVEQATLVPTELRVIRPNTSRPTDSFGTPTGTVGNRSSLTNRPRATAVSVVDPLVVGGRLTTGGAAIDDTDTPSGGSAIANASIQLRLGEENITGRTDSDGQFRLRLRPRTVSPNVTEAVVRYLPADDAITATSSRSLPVNVTRVDSAVTATATPQRAGFGDRLRVSGRVTAANDESNGTAIESTGIGNATFVVRLGDRVVARNETAPDGTYEVAVSVPSRVLDGERNLSVTLPAENSSVTDGRANTTVTVVERTPNVSVAAASVDDRTVRVTGNVTVGDVPVDGRQVSIVFGDTPVGTATTGTSGVFRTTVVVPADQRSRVLGTGTTDVRVRAVYRGTEGNLARAAAGETVSIPTAGVPTSLVLGGGLAVAVLLGVSALVVYRRRRSVSSDTPERGLEDGDDDDSGGGSSADDPREGPGPKTLLTAARAALDSDADRAIRSAYAAVRQRLQADLPPTDERRTHWEFYRDCRDAGVDEEAVSTLREVTERYEQIVYATEPVSAEAAAATLDRVAALVDERRPSRADGGSAARANEPGDSTGPTTPMED